MSALDTHTEPVTLDDQFVHMSNFDQRVALFHGAGNNTGVQILRQCRCPWWPWWLSLPWSATQQWQGQQQCQKPQQQQRCSSHQRAALLHQQQGSPELHQEPSRRHQLSNLGKARALSEGLLIPVRKFHLRKILHVPSASKNLLSVHHIAIDNHVFLGFTPFSF